MPRISYKFDFDGFCYRNGKSLSKMSEVLGIKSNALYSARRRGVVSLDMLGELRHKFPNADEFVSVDNRKIQRKAV